MKKFLLLVAVAAMSLVGCDVQDSTPTVFQFEQYAYSVKFSANPKPAGLLAMEVTYVDADGQTQTKTVTDSWSYVVPAKKGFIMKMTSKLVLAPGQSRPTSGNEVNFSFSVGICGAQGGQPTGGFFDHEMYSLQVTSPGAYQGINVLLDGPAKTTEYEIKPMVEAGMFN